MSIVAALAVAGCEQPQPPVAAPAVELVSIEGERIAFAGLRGKVVLLNFWSTSCEVCLREMPAMAATYRTFQSRGMEALFVAMPYDRPDHVLHYARTRALPLKIALDVQGEVARAFGGIAATPTTLIIDREGRIVRRILGAPDFAELHAFIERTLGARS